jgi:outer membrane protein OmpA-like peptidoglycan-associated protein
LGPALGDDKLKGSVFLVAGHTDAKGSDVYNLDLSDRRAKSVQAFLIELTSTPSSSWRLVSARSSSRTSAAENRRVQVVNIASEDVSAKAEPGEANE